jgi:hypothetical protein
MLANRRSVGFGTPYLEYPLCALPREVATALIARLYAPDQRFARAFYRYWREVLGQSEEEASRSTAAELVESMEALQGNLADPCVHTIGIDHGQDYEPIGIFAFRPLHEHTQGRMLRDAMRSGPLETRYCGRSAIAHAVALLDEHAARAAFDNILLSIARKALTGGFAFVFFYTSDDRLEFLYRRYGMDFPPDLRLPHSAHLVGVYDPTRPANLERMRRTADRLGIDLAFPVSA